MTSPDLIELAKQGNIQAIAIIIRDTIPENVKLVKCELKDNCLQIILEGKKLPNQKLTISISDRLSNLEINCLQKIVIHGKISKKKSLQWNEELELNQDRDAGQKKLKREFKKNDFVKNLRTFDVDSVVPYKEALSRSLYKSNFVKLLLFFGLFPWIVTFIAGYSGFQELKQIAWVLGIYYASIWGVVLFHLIKPPIFSWQETIKSVVFTAFIGIPLLLMAQKYPPFNVLYNATESRDLFLRIVGFIFGVGLLEETCKSLPIYLLILRTKKLKEPLTGAFYGAMSGLGFAIAEGVNYSLQYAVILEKGDVAVSNYVLFSTVRFISLPLIHAMWAGIVGYFFGLAVINPSRKNEIIFIGIAISAVLHGLYDTFSNSLAGLAILTFSILLFVTYLRLSKDIVEEMKQAENTHKK